MDKEVFICSLIKPVTEILAKKKIEMVSNDECAQCEIKSDATNILTVTEPTMMDLMMAAHIEAKLNEVKNVSRQNLEESKKSIHGFKKGFFSNNKTTNKNSKPTINGTNNEATSNIKNMISKPSDALFLPDVQLAMSGNPFVKQLKQGGKIGHIFEL